MTTNKTTPRTRTITLVDKTGSRYRWTCRHFTGIRSIDPDGPGTPTRILSGWEYMDHDGYPRFQEGTWHDLIPRLRMTAENYSLTITTDLGDGTADLLGALQWAESCFSAYLGAADPVERDYYRPDADHALAAMQAAIAKATGAV